MYEFYACKVAFAVAIRSVRA